MESEDFWRAKWLYCRMGSPETGAESALAYPMPGQNPVPAGAYDLHELGCVEQEFVLRGSATSYRLAGDRSRDGQPAASRLDAKPGGTTSTATTTGSPPAASGPRGPTFR